MRKLFLFGKRPGIIYGAVAIATALVILSFFHFRLQVNSYIDQDMRSQVEEIQRNSSLLVQKELSYLKRLTASAAQIVNNTELQTDEDIIQTLQRYAETSNVIRTLFITLDGHVYTNYAGYLGQSEAATSIDGVPLSEIREPIFSQPYYAQELDEVIFGVSAPTTMANKRGVLVSSYDIKEFSILLERKAMDDSVEIGIINSRGEVISGESDDDFMLNIFDHLKKVEFQYSSAETMQAEFESGKSGFSIYRVKGVARYCSYAPVGMNDWVIVVMVRESSLRSKLVNLERYGFQLTVELVLVMLGLLIVIMAARLREQKKTRMILERAAKLDGLTGIYNRKAIEETIEQHLTNDKEETAAALLVIDVDNFKQINDQRGHLFGDLVLRECASRLNDLFGEEGVVGRIGGDEFVVFLLDYQDPKQIDEKITELIHHFYILTDTGDKQKISVSVGIAQAGQKAHTFLALYQLADDALYRAKQTGKGKLSK